MDYITRNDRSGLVRNIKDEQDVMIDNERLDKPVYAVLEFDDIGNLIYEDYSKLEVALDKFIKTYKRHYVKEDYDYVRLNDLKKIKLCLLEEYYAFEYLKRKNIKVRGISEDIYYDNYESITTHKNEKTLEPNNIAPWNVQKYWFLDYHKAIDIGDSKTANKYIELIFINNKKLLKYFTNKVMRRYNLPQEDFEDCLSYANIAFLNSMSSFDVNVGCRFSTYLCIAIKNTVLREWLRDKGLGTNWEEYFKYKRGVDAASEALYESGIDRKPTYDELEQLFTYTETLPRPAVSRLYEKTSLMNADSIDDERLFSRYVNDKDNFTSSDTLSDEELTLPEGEELVLDFDLENEADLQNLSEALIKVLNTLTDKQRDVLIKRYGLIDGSPKTLEEVAKEFGVTRERIRQIEAKALRILRHPSRSKIIKDYVNPNTDVIVGHKKI